jgi:hypothetical protein
MNHPIQIGRIVHFVLPNGWHRPAQILDVGSEVRGGPSNEEGQLLEVHPIPGEGSGFAELVEGIPIFYARAREGHHAREWHWHTDCKANGGQYLEEEPSAIPISLHAPPHLRWSASAMAGGEERLELVHIPGECANCDALR